MMKNLFAALAFSLMTVLQLFSQNTNLAKINTEGVQNSEVMHIIAELSDVYAPRLTGTHQYYKAAEWAKQSMENWGLDKVYFEDYCDDCMGWEVNSFNVEMTAPTYMKIEAYPYAWTEGSKGFQEADLVWIQDYKNLEKVKEAWQGKLKGKTVLIGKAPDQNLLFDPLSTRRSEEELKICRSINLTCR